MSKPLTVLALVALLLGGCTDISDTRPDVVRKSEYYLEQGVEAYQNSDYVAAASLFGKALAHYRSIDDAHGTVLSLINLTETALATGQYESAFEQLERAEQIAEQQAMPRYDDRIRLLRAQTLWHVGDYSNTLSALSPLIPAFSEDNTPQQQPTHITIAALALRAELALEQTQIPLTSARLWLSRLDNAMAQLDAPSPTELAKRNRLEAGLMLRTGNTDPALALLQRALEQYQREVQRAAIAGTLMEMARLHMGERQWSAAIDKLERALYIRLWTMDRKGSEEALRMLAKAYQQVGDEGGARRALQQADVIAEGEISWQELRESH